MQHKETIGASERGGRLVVDPEIDLLMLQRMCQRYSQVKESFETVDRRISSLTQSVNALVSRRDECPRLLYFYMKPKQWTDWINDPAKRLLTNSVMMVFVCPITLQMVPGCGPDELGWEVTNPKKWFKKWGPAIMVTIKVLRVALALGKIAGVPLPTIPSVEDLGEK